MQNTLLIVDDEPNILRTLQRLFSTENYQVLTANSGQEALKLLEENPVQVIISDQRMPNMTGSQFLTRAKNLYPNTVRIMLSGYADFEAVTTAINEGSIYKFIGKPWDDEVLLQHVRESFKINLQQKNKEHQLTQLMYSDKLTGLSNRFCFGQLLTQEIIEARQHNKKFMVVYIDLDRFSTMNGTLGHNIGDQLLQAVAQRLKVKDKPWCHIARVGSDEFAMILSDFSLIPAAETFLKDLLKELKPVFILGENQLYLTCSIGVSIYPQHGNNTNNLIEHANLALQKSKKLGGDNYQFYTETLSKPVVKELILEADLHQAFEKNQFVIYYQPIITANSGEIHHAEALIRWQHPVYGFLTPDRFLSLCEATGLIIPIGEWVLRTVCEQISRWNKIGYLDLCVSVNLSSRQFNDKKLIELMTDILRTSKIPSICLELEITESLIMQNVESNIAQLQALYDLGFILALDDFGTGYSSLSYLKNFPFSILKIDKSFIQDITTADDSAAIVEAIIALGKSLGLILVAEGVETEEQLNFLKERHCDLIQGYLFSKPVPTDDFTRLLLSNA